MNIKALIKQLEGRRDAIGKERDRLQDLENECTDLAESCNEAVRDIESAIDSLSKFA